MSNKAYDLGISLEEMAAALKTALERVSPLALATTDSKYRLTLIHTDFQCQTNRKGKQCSRPEILYFGTCSKSR